MARNGFFGVKNSHFALCTDQDAFKYEAPVHVAGTVEIKMEVSVSSTASHADNGTWIDKMLDNGGSGTMSFYDVEQTKEFRKLFAAMTGYGVDSHGRMILLADKEPQPFAFMCEQPGHVMGKRKCLLMCKMTKPNMDAATTEDDAEITQLDFDFTWRPVTLPNGTYTSGYNDYSNTDTYSKFFEAVDIDLAEEQAEDTEKADADAGADTGTKA